MKNNNSSQYYLDVAIQFFLILILTLVPIYFTSMIHNAFTIEKHVIFRFCVLAMLALSAVKYAYFPSKNKMNWMFWLVPVFGLVGVLSTMFSINPAVSLWGIHLRMDGLVNMLFLVTFFVLTYWQIDTKTKLKQVLMAISLGTVIPVAYAFMQKMGADPLGWKDIVVEERVFSTTGNPAYLGAYLLFSIPVTLYMGLKRQSLKKYFYYALTIAQIVVLVLTWTRAAYLALGVEVAIFSLVYFWITNRKRLFYVTGVIVATGVLFVGALNLNSGFAKTFEGNRYIERLSQLTQTEEGTGKDRLEMWGVAGKAISERPILGSGLSQYIQYFNKYYPNYMDARPEKDRYSNYSHNLWLDTGVAHGVAGMGLLALIYLTVIWSGVKNIRLSEENNKKFLYLAFVVGIVGYLVQAMFNIETIITWVYSFGFLAILLAAINIDEEAESKILPVSALKQIGATVIVVGSLFGIYFLAINAWSADKNYFYINNTDLPISDKLELAEEAVMYTPYFEYSHVRIGDIYASQIDFTKTDEAIIVFEKTIEQVQKATEINPLNYKNYMSLATLYSNWAQMDISKLDEAEKFYDQAKTLSPDRLGFHWVKGNAYLDLNMVDEAKIEFETAKQLNEDVGETYYNLAKVAYLQNNKEEADQLLALASEKGYVFQELKFYQDMSLLSYKRGNYTMANLLSSQANDLTVTEMTAMIEIQTYLELDQTDTASALLQEYKKLVPGLEKHFVLAQ